MKRPTTDPELRDAIRQLAPGVDTSTFCQELQERCAGKKQSRYRRRRLRLVAISAAVVVALAAVSAGLVTGLNHLRDTQSVIVFTDGAATDDPSLVSTTTVITPTTEGPSLVSTTTVITPTTEGPSLSSTTTTMGVGPTFAWGEEAVLEGRTIMVEQPVEAPDETVEASGELGVGASSVRVAVYSLVTITNTGSEPLTCASQEFFLMGKSSGSSGTNFGSEKTLAGHGVLDYLVTLQPGESVKVAVRFELTQGDHPVKVLLGTRDSTGYIHSSTSEWLALWQ
jgi:hypothetical protein